MYYQVNNVKIFVVDEGDQSPVLLFIHFWGGSSNTWEGVAKLLKGKYRCVRFDQRGWGESEKPEDGYSIGSLVEDLRVLIDQLKLDNYILVGHSMGGKIAQAFAAQKPAGLKKLILVAPSPAVPTIMPAEIHEGMMNAYASLESINATIDQVFQAGDLPAPVRAKVVEDMQKHSQSSRLGWPRIGLGEDVSAGLENIDIPTLVIAGENDLVDPPARLEVEVVQRIPGARMVVVPAVGHLLMVQHPSKVAELIDGFCK